MKSGGFLVVGLVSVGICVPLAWAQAVGGDSSAALTRPGLTLITLFQKGGPVMYPILGCSIVGLSIVLERLWALRRRKVIPEDFLREIGKHWSMESRQRALDVCNRYPVSISRILRSGLLRFDTTIEEIEHAVERAGAHEVTLLSANLRTLGAIGSLSTMLGLLGTITGMIRAFNAISLAGTGNPSVVASGIAEALLTTAFGLIVGIPIVALYHALRNRVEKFVYAMEEICIQLMQQLVTNRKNIPVS